MRLHDTFHVGRPAKLSGDKHTRRADDTVRNSNLLDLVAENVLDRLGQTFKLGGFFLTLLLLLLSLLELQAFLRDRDKLLALKLLQLRHGILIDRIHHEKNLKALLLEHFQERRVLHSRETLTRQEVNVLLDLGHARNVVGKARHLVATLGRVEAQELSELGTVRGVFVNTKLDVLAKGIVELAEVLLVLGKLRDHLKGLLHNVLTNDLENLVLLERLTRNVERQVLGVNNALHKVEVFWDKLLAVVSDEHTTDIKANVVALLLRLEHIEGSTLGNVQKGFEL